MLSMTGKPTVSAKMSEPVKSEEGPPLIADKTLGELEIEEYDASLLTGSVDIREAVGDEKIIKFVKEFDKKEIIIGAISIAPVLLPRTPAQGKSIYGWLEL